jgi:Leu/Phe-tRNA-protein transferase
MFSSERDASKVALKLLVDVAVERDFELIDCQVEALTSRVLGAQNTAG